MKYEKYEPSLLSNDVLGFKFNSKGPKGDISIVVQFMKTNDPEIYNLVFGNLLPDGSIDDNARNDNLDRNKILATVKAIVYEFSAVYPEKRIFFAGSTPARTRLYWRALTNNLEELSADFEINGVSLYNNLYWQESFSKDGEYYGFIVKRKRGANP